jgi:hypothetical protein
MESGNEQPPTDSERADDKMAGILRLRAGMERWRDSSLLERAATDIE